MFGEGTARISNMNANQEKPRISSSKSKPRSKEAEKLRASNGGTDNHVVEERPVTAPADQRKGCLAKPSIKVNGGPSYSSWKETNAPTFRPAKRFLPEGNSRVLDWRPSRRHPCSTQCNHYQPEFAFIYRPDLDTGKENSMSSFRPCKRYIPEYYPKEKEWRPSRMHSCSRQCAHQGQDENVCNNSETTSRPKADVSSRTLVSKPMAPQGRLNEYIIDGHFHRVKQPKELLTEQKASFVNCKPWIRQGIFEEATQAYKENLTRAASVDLSMTRHLYEDRTSLVNRRPSTAGGHILDSSSRKSSIASDAPLHITETS